MGVKETIKQLEGYVISCVERDVATGKPYVDWEAFGVLIEAYEQSKWVEFDANDESTWPDNDLICLLAVKPRKGKKHKQYTGRFQRKYKAFKYVLGNVTNWQPLPEPPKK